VSSDAGRLDNIRAVFKTKYTLRSPLVNFRLIGIFKIEGIVTSGRNCIGETFHCVWCI
jgi:hypothetical protein